LGSPHEGSPRRLALLHTPIATRVSTGLGGPRPSYRARSHRRRHSIRAAHPPERYPSRRSGVVSIPTVRILQWSGRSGVEDRSAGHRRGRMSIGGRPRRRPCSGAAVVPPSHTTSIRPLRPVVVPLPGERPSPTTGPHSGQSASGHRNFPVPSLRIAIG
jgi:hypothetical protein